MEGPSAAQGLRHPQAGHRLGAREPGDRERTVAMDHPNVTTTVLGADEIILNMGPQHPSTHGVLRVKLKLDGEKVIGSECIIGYLHRGVEKIGEDRTYPQVAPSVDRPDYVAAGPKAAGTPARIPPTPPTTSSSLTSPSASGATPTTVTWCGWRKCGSRAASSCRRWTRFRKGRSWPGGGRASSRLRARATIPSKRPRGNSATN